MTGFRFGTAINCIDGRTHEAVIDHMKKNYNIDGVDMVTFPGADGIVSDRGKSSEIALFKSAVGISIEKHGSHVIAIVGHHDCAGNPGDREHHYKHIRKAMGEVTSWHFPARVVGFYVNDKRKIEEVE
ncbi:MAG TPA: carbonic anhydrase [Nitrososphaera sp.]|jgi:hypothetical protein